MLPTAVAVNICIVFLICNTYSISSLHASSTYKVWALAYNVDLQAGNISACTFSSTIYAVKCEYFDLSKLFLAKGSNPNFIIGYVPVVLDAPPPADMQLCLEVQQEPNTNSNRLFQCKPVIKDNKGFYIAKFNLKGMKPDTPALANSLASNGTGKNNLKPEVLSRTPYISITPNCAPPLSSPFMMITGKGLKPMSNINWKLQNPQGEMMSTYSIQTDAAGNLNETTFTEGLTRGHYKFWFGYDSNYDNKFDDGYTIKIADFYIPCASPEANVMDIDQQTSLPKDYADIYPEKKVTSVRIAPGSSSEDNNRGFSPEVVKIPLDSSVSWTNDDSVIHTVTSGRPTLGIGGYDFDFYLAPGQTLKHKFDSYIPSDTSSSVAEPIDYYCSLHPFMTAKVIVQLP